MIIRPAFILGGGGTGIAHDRDEMRARRRARARREPDLRDPDRAQRRGLEGVRARSDARPRRQRRRHLLDREPRPDGRAHRRVDHGRARADAHRRRVPAHARRRVRVHPADRRRDRRLERAVRGAPADGRAGHHRDEPARVAESARSRARPPGFPIAKIAAKLAVGYRLDEVQNDITRETPASFEPTIDYVVTKIPRWAFEKLPGRDPGARHADAVGRRGDGDRPHVHRVAAEGAALARDRSARAQLRSGRARARRARRRRARARGRGPDARARCSRSRPRCAGSSRSSACTRSPASTLVPRPDPADRRGARPARAKLGRRRDDAAPTGAARSGSASPTRSSRTSGTSTEADVRAARLAAGVRVTYKTVDTCAAEFAAYTPYHYGTYEDEDEIAPLTQSGGRDPRQRSEPHRPGRRVRLLLRARRVRVARRRASRP